MGIGPNPHDYAAQLDVMYPDEDGRAWVDVQASTFSSASHIIRTVAYGPGSFIRVSFWPDSGAGVTINTTFVPTEINVHFVPGVSTYDDAATAIAGDVTASGLITAAGLVGDTVTMDQVGGGVLLHGTDTPLQFQNQNLYSPILYPCKIRVFADSFWDGGNVTVVGTDKDDLPISETVTPVAYDYVITSKYFKTVTNDSYRTTTTSSHSFAEVGISQGPLAIIPDTPYTDAEWFALSGVTASDLYCVWGAAADDVWACGADGTVIHYNGSAWSVVSTPAGSDWYLTGVHGISSTDVWIVGTDAGGHGKSMHWDGASWTLVDTGVDGHNTPWLGVYMVATDDVWGSSQFGRIFHWDGAAWTLSDTSSEFRYRFWGATANDVWCGSALGNTVHWDGAAWTEVQVERPSAQYFVNTWGFNANDIYMVGGGEDGGISGTIYHWNGTTWSLHFGEAEPSPGTPDEFEGVWGWDNTNIWASSFSGTMMHWDGTTWQDITLPSHPGYLASIWGSAPNFAWAVGTAGTILNLRSPPPADFDVTSVTGGDKTVTVVLGGNALLTGDSLSPSKWVVSAGAEPRGVPLTVTEVSLSGATITLTTNEATIGANYNLSVPAGILKLSDSSALLPPFVWSFAGSGVSPTAFAAQVIDARHVRVIFSESVNEGATDKANYNIDNGLQVLGVAQETSRNYILTTTEQAAGTMYTITITDVFDNADNPT